MSVSNKAFKKWKRRIKKYDHKRALNWNERPNKASKILGREDEMERTEEGAKDDMLVTSMLFPLPCPAFVKTQIQDGKL
jgi:hypothetical protein